MSGGNQQTDSTMDFMYLVVAIMIVLVIAWYFWGVHIKFGFLWFRYQIVQFFQMFSFLDSKALRQSAFMITNFAPNEWDIQDLKRLSMDLRWYLFPPLALTLIGYAFFVWKKNPANSYKRVHSRKSLLISEVRQWPWCAPVLSLDLVKASIDKGPWAMATKPLDYARKYKLLEDGKVLNRKHAAKLFAMQLGDLWNGPDRLPKHIQALFACFVAQVCRDKDGAINGLRALALRIAEGSVDYSWVKPLLEKHYKDERVQAVIKKHAYTTTVLCGMLEASRKNGVLPPNYFLWLRPLNRNLWYSLNCVGRKTYFSEVSGIHAHFLAERVAGNRIERPYVEKAVNALEEALKEIIIE